MAKSTQLRAGPGLVAAAVLATVAAVSVAVAPVVAAEQPRQSATRSEQPCPELPELPTHCGSIRVPLDRADPDAGQTTVAYALVRHRGTEPALGTIAFNPGGPGLAPIVGLAVANAKTLGRKIALNPSEVRAVPTVAWPRVLDKFRKRRGLP